MLSVSEVAARLGVSPSAVYRLCDAGLIRHHRVGLNRGKIRVPEDAVTDYLRSCEVTSANSPSASVRKPQPAQVRRSNLRPDGKPWRFVKRA